MFLPLRFTSVWCNGERLIKDDVKRAEVAQRVSDFWASPSAPRSFRSLDFSPPSDYFTFGLLLGRRLPAADLCSPPVGQEPYLQSVCECCSYRLDPDTPVRFLSLRCDSGESEPVVLPVIHSCECTSCQGGGALREICMCRSHMSAAGWGWGWGSRAIYTYANKWVCASHLCLYIEPRSHRWKEEKKQPVLVWSRSDSGNLFKYISDKHVNKYNRR